ncbi:MAG: AraC family transcriptional regulator ligand-binding domain-containing protein [Pseudomonadota bacterium]
MSDKPIRYKIARTTEQLCGLLGIETTAVMRRMGMPEDFLENEGRGVTVDEFFRGWLAIEAEANRSDFPLFLGQAYARGPFNSAFFAFTCSPTVAIGLERLALFKPLTGPLSLMLSRDEDRLRIIKTTNTPGVPLPASFAATELVFLIEAIRTCTGYPVKPLDATLPQDVTARSQIEMFLGCPIRIEGSAALTLAPEDADRVLLSRDPAQWANMEPAFRRELDMLRAGQSTASRLHAVLAEMLPSGASDIGEAADRMRLSRRSLQRRLKDEDQSFQAILEDTRRSMALHYLETTELSTDEISYLLAYRDPNSFYRAFQGWTGMTPGMVRAGAPSARTG